MFKYTIGGYNFWEVLIAAIMSAFFWLFGNLSGTLFFICVMVLFDMITGIMRAGVDGEFESVKIMATVKKLTGYAILIATLHLIFIRFLPNLSTVPGSGNPMIPTVITEPMIAIPYVIAALMILREGTSIIENLVGAKIIPREYADRIGRAFKNVNKSFAEDADPPS